MSHVRCALCALLVALAAAAASATLVVRTPSAPGEAAPRETRSAPPLTRSPAATHEAGREGVEAPTAPVQRAATPLESSGGARSERRPAARLAGRVESPEGVPIGGATLHDAEALDAARALATTGADGRFVLEEAPAVLEARAARHASARLATAGFRGEIVLVLARGESLRGQVVSREDGRPVRGARIDAASGDWRGASATDACGSFVVEDAPAGAVVALRASCPGLVPASVEAVADPRTPDVRLSLERGARLRGRVVDRAGAPVVAEVHAFARPGPPEAQVTTSARDGSFEVHGLPEGARVAVLALTPRLATPLDALEWRSVREDVTVVAAPRGALVVTGLPEGRFDLEPVDAPGELPFAVRRFVAEEADASVRAARLAAGRYRLSRDGAAASTPFAVGVDETATVAWSEVALPGREQPATEAGAPLRVLVADPEGRALAGATVVVGVATGDVTARTGPDGTVELDALPAGPATVWAARDGRALLRPAETCVAPRGAAPSSVALVLITPPEGETMVRGDSK